MRRPARALAIRARRIISEDIDRNDNGNIGPVCRFEYTGDMGLWEFAIYKYSLGDYSQDECFFPGEDHVDGTIQGPMMCGLEAYYD